MPRFLWTTITVAAMLPLAAIAQPPSPEALTAALSGDDTEARRTAWETAPGMGAAAVLPVAALLGDDDPGVVRAAERALAGITTRAEGAELRAVSLALIEAMGLDLPLAGRVELLRYLSWVAGDEAVRPLSKWVDSSGLGIRALMTLSRIPGTAARNALAALANSDDETVATAATRALGDRGEPGTEGRLMSIVRASQGEVRVAAIRALGSVGTTRSLGLCAEVAGSGSEAERWAAVDSALRVAQRLEARGDESTALDVYRTVLVPPQPVQIADAQRLAAVAGIARLGSDADVPMVLRGLTSSDPILLSTALRFVEEVVGEDALGVLADEAAELPAPQRAALTWMISQLETDDPVPYLVAALGADATEVTIAAARGLANRPDPRACDALRAVVVSGPAEAREPALEAMLSILDADEDEALADPTGSYEFALERTQSAANASRALLGLARHATPEMASLVRPYIDDPDTRLAALTAFTTIGFATAQSGDQARAREVLTEAVRLGPPRDTATAAIRVLRQLGVDEDFAAAAGFITSWRVIGPFGASLTAWDQPLEGLPEAESTQPLHGLEWRSVDTPDIQGIVDLFALMEPRENVVAYAEAEFVSPVAGPAVLGIGSDDGVVVWLNGERVHQNNAARPVTVDEDKVTVTLREGTNRIVLKVLQGGGQWGYTVRVMTSDGTPIELESVPPQA